MDKIRAQIFDRHTGLPVKNKPVAIDVNIKPFTPNSRLLEESVDSESGRMETHSLGVVSSNHVGYLSIPISRSRDAEDALRKGVIDGIAFRFPGTDSEHEYTVNTNKLDIIHPLQIDISDLDRPVSTSFLPSVDQPDLLDWKLSPKSFGAIDFPIIGEDGCETILPSQVADRSFSFSEIIRQIDREDETFSVRDSPDATMDISFGRLNTYIMTWTPINHGLGQILYSLTLAPCEVINISIIDWTREDAVTRDETTGISENLLHDQRRERTIDEAVEGMVEEFQKGKSLLGGTAGVGGYGMGSWGVTGSHAIGIGRSESRGERSSSASTIQNISDGIAQSSNALRQLRSSVVLQTTQRERDVVQTRAVRNHNHCHALTVLYYEVVRHYCVQTKLATVRDVVFVNYSDVMIDEFTPRALVDNRLILERYLLDDSLSQYFHYAEKLVYEYDDLPADPPTIEAPTITSVSVDILTGGNGTNQDVYIRLQLVDGTTWEVEVDPDGNSFEQNTVTSQRFTNAEGVPSIPRNEIFRVGVRYNTGRASWAFAGIRILVSDSEGTTLHTLYDSANDLSAVPPLPITFDRDSEWWSSPLDHTEIPPEILEYNRLVAIRDNDMKKAQRLIDHLNVNKHFYNKLLWIHEDPDARATRFANYVSGSTSLIDRIDNQILGISGHHVIFASGRTEVHEPSNDNPIYPVEQIISVPTRGAFAESKLSHCNGCEKVDDTRFWKWEESPCPDVAPQIENIQPGSRFNSLSGTGPNLPSGSIGIQAPADAPDPSGLNDVLDLLKTSEIFRDMSGISELRPLLETLTNAAAEVEGKRLEQQGETERERIKADSKNNENNVGATNDSGSSGSGTPGNSSNTSTEAVSNARQSPARSIISEGQGLREILNQGIDQGWISDDFAEEQYRIFAQNAVTDESQETASDVSTGDWWERQPPETVETFEIQVPFHSDYEIFRQRVARSPEISSRMISRSNPDYAERVLDRRPDLRDIHSGFSDAGVEDDLIFTMIAHMLRDNRGYVLVIRLLYPSVDFDPDPITVDTLEIQHRELVLLNASFDRLVDEVLGNRGTFLGLPDSHDILLPSTISTYANNLIRLSRGQNTLIPPEVSRVIAQPVVDGAISDWNSLTPTSSQPALSENSQLLVNQLRNWARQTLLENGNTRDLRVINAFVETINGYRNF